MKLILLLLVAINISKAYDGCGLALWRCGDLCIGDSAPCHCGNETIFFKEKNPETKFTTTHSKWCCATTTCQGLGVADVMGDFQGAFLLGARCSSGKVRKLSQPCPKHLPSTKGTVTQEREELGGTATMSCNNYDDPEVDTPAGLRSYLPCWQPGQKITECIQKSHQGNGRYDCQSRSDENPFSKDTSVFDLPTSIMTECEDDENRPGLICPGHGCLPLDDWCQIKTVGKEGRVYGPKRCDLPGQKYFFSNDDKVCSHPTFWRDKKCSEYRCNGAFPGQCGSTVSGRGDQRKENIF